MLVTECAKSAEGACDVSVVTRDGASTPLLTLTPDTWVVGGDDQHVVVRESSPEGSEENSFWVLDREQRTGARLVGDHVYDPWLADERVVLSADRGVEGDQRPVIVVDLETRTVERLLVDERIGDTVIAGDHVAWTTTGCTARTRSST